MNAVVKNIMILFFTIALSLLVIVIDANISIIKVFVLNLKSKKLPLKHKFSYWSGNGDSLKRFIPKLITDAYGFNIKGVNSYIIVDRKIKEFLNNKVSNKEKLLISEMLSKYELIDIKGDTYVDYFNKVNLHVLLDDDVFDMFENDKTVITKVKNFKKYRENYNDHLNAGYVNGKNFSFASDVIRYVGLYILGNPGDVILYSDVDVEFDYRMLKERVTVNEAIFMMNFGMFNPINNSLLTIKNIKKILRKNVVTFFTNDIFLVIARSDIIIDVINYAIDFSEIFKETYFFHCYKSNTKYGYELNKHSFYDFLFSVLHEDKSTNINIVNKKHFNKSFSRAFGKFVIYDPEINSNKFKMQIKKQIQKDSNSKVSDLYKVVQKFVESDDYYVFSDKIIYLYAGLSNLYEPVYIGFGPKLNPRYTLHLAYRLTMVMSYLLRSLSLSVVDIGVTGRLFVQSWLVDCKRPIKEDVLFKTIVTQKDFDDCVNKGIDDFKVNRLSTWDSPENIFKIFALE